MSSDVPFSHTALTEEEAAAVHPGEVHEVTEKQYIIIALMLAVLTALEVAATEIDIGVALVPALLVMMAVKFFVVVSYFMHLKFDNRLFSVMFYLGLALAVTLYAVVLATFHFFT
jgi:cytochrome c oxidase subunit 4